MLWRHVLVGATVTAIEPSPRGNVLVLAAPSFAEKFKAEALRVEFRGGVPRVVRAGETVGVSLSEWHVTHSLVLTTTDDPHLLTFTATSRQNPEETCALHISPVGTLGRIETPAGQVLSMMKLSSVAQSSIFKENALVPTAELNRRKKVGLKNLRTTLAAAGFKGSEAFQHRERENFAQAIELVNSRWNTHVGVAFHFVMHVRFGDFRKTNVRSLQSLLGPPLRPGFQRSSYDVLRGVVHPGIEASEPSFTVGQETTVEKLDEQLQTAFTQRILPWLDSIDDVDSAVRVLSTEKQGDHDAECGFLLAAAGRADEARTFLRRVPMAPDMMQRSLKNYGISLTL